MEKLETLKTIYKINDENIEFLIHGQNVDIRNEIIFILKKSYPKRFNYCYYLHISEKKFEERLKKRNKEQLEFGFPQYTHDYIKLYKSKQKTLDVLNEIFNNVYVVDI
jgi:deoxyadenosine/deoxycytidine kinase